MTQIKKLFSVAIASSALIGTAAMATPPATVSELAASVSFSDTSLAILAVTGTLITLTVVWTGAKFVLRAVKGH